MKCSFERKWNKYMKKNRLDSNLIFIAMNGHFSLQWIFIAKIFFIAMNSLFADQYNPDTLI